MSDSEILIKVENVSKKFCYRLRRSLWYGVKDLTAEFLGRDGHRYLRRDEFWAVKDVSFELKRGDRLAIIGANGAGKTTVLRMLNGLIKPDRGRIAIRGRVGALIALGAGFNPILAARENIYVNAAVLGLSKHKVDKILDDIIDFAGIADFIDMPVQSYSSGMLVRLGFSVAIHLQPDIFLIDEVLAVGDFAFQKKCFDRLDEITARGTTIIFVSHSMAAVQRLCPVAMLMECGRVVTLDDSREAVARYYQTMSRADVQHSETDPNRNRIIHRGVGSMAVYLTGFKVLDDKMQPVKRIPSGAFLRFVLRIRSQDGMSERLPRIAIRVVDPQTEELLANIQTPQRLIHEAKRRRELILECDVPSFNLAPGVYRLETKIGGDGEDLHDYALVDQPLEVNWLGDIVDNMSYKGKVYLPGEWRVGIGSNQEDL